MAETEHTAGPVESIIADVRVSRKRLLKWVESDLPNMEPGEAIRYLVVEMANNVYPTIEATLEQVAEVDEAVLEMVDQQGSFIQPELVAQIFQTINIGGTICDEIKKLNLDDLTKKKLSDLTAAFEKSAEITTMGVTASMTDGDDEDEPPETETPEAPATDTEETIDA